MSERDPAFVITAILQLVPNESQWLRLRERLIDVRRMALCYSLDESGAWRQLAVVLATEFSIEPETDWMRAISEIVKGRRPLPATTKGARL